MAHPKGGDGVTHKPLLWSNVSFLVLDSYQRLKLLALSDRCVRGGAGGGDRQVQRIRGHGGKEGVVAGSLKPLSFSLTSVVFFAHLPLEKHLRFKTFKNSSKYVVTSILSILTLLNVFRAIQRT